jgi:hypothetical protein
MTVNRAGIDSPGWSHREEEGEAVRRGDPGLKDKIAIQGPTLCASRIHPLTLLAMTGLRNSRFVWDDSAFSHSSSTASFYGAKPVLVDIDRFYLLF